jgi:DNA-binding PadR family transcriptional regulator
MERKGWIESEWDTSELGKRIKVYSLTTDGRRQLRSEAAQWAHFVAAVSAIMGTP